MSQCSDDCTCRVDAEIKRRKDMDGKAEKLKELKKKYTTSKKIIPPHNHGKKMKKFKEYHDQVMEEISAIADRKNNVNPIYFGDYSHAFDICMKRMLNDHAQKIEKLEAKILELQNPNHTNV